MNGARPISAISAASLGYAENDRAEDDGADDGSPAGRNRHRSRVLRKHAAPDELGDADADRRGLEELRAEVFERDLPTAPLDQVDHLDRRAAMFEERIEADV